MAEPTEMREQRQGLSQLSEVRATFPTSDRMQAAVNELTMNGFDRAELTLPARGHSLNEPGSEGDKSVTTEEDARQVRTLGASTAASAVGMAAAGIVIATGGAALPAVAAAVLGGAAAGGATFAATEAGVASEQQTRDDQAAAGHLVLSVRTSTAEKVEKAKAILTSAGGTNVQTIGE